MPPANPGRLKSLDIFRGFAIAGMLLVNNPGVREHAYPQLSHAAWHGWTFADTIFPAFLWIVGVALTLSTASRREGGTSTGLLLLHTLRRAALLFGCGLLLEMIVFPVRTFPYVALITRLQLTGVLQKIAVCYLLAYLIFFWTRWQGVVVGVIVLNAVYLALIFFYPVPGCGAGLWTEECNFPGYIDRRVLDGYMWGNLGMQDPDGIGSLLPAVSSVLLGVLAGYLIRARMTPEQRTQRLLGMGCGLACGGLLLSLWIPVNKILWTPSYALLMAGLGTVFFALWYWVADIRQLGGWFKPLEMFGRNAIAAYMASRLGMNIPKVHLFGKSLYYDLCLRVASPANASLLYASLHVLGVYLLVWWMYRQRWFLKF